MKRCSSSVLVLPTLPLNTRWNQQAITVLKELYWPRGLAVDEDDGTVYVADHNNHRIMATTADNDGKTNVLVAGGNGQGSGLDQLNYPIDVLMDKETRSLIISDRNNHRIIRWSLEKGTKQGEIMIGNIQYCFGLAIDDEGALYVSSTSTHNVRRFPRGDKTGTVVAGGNEHGSGLHEFYNPYYIAVDGEGTLYVSDNSNHRVMKWSKGATQGVVVAGHGGEGNAPTQLSYPEGVLVDTDGTVYVAEARNDRVTRWQKGAMKGELVVGGDGRGSQANQFHCPVGMSFDNHGHLFVADYYNNRVQRFSIA